MADERCFASTLGRRSLWFTDVSFASWQLAIANGPRAIMFCTKKDDVAAVRFLVRLKRRPSFESGSATPH
jgi:hypothetical protein